MNKKKYFPPAPVKSFIKFNNPIERWRRIHDVIDGNYYVSSEGRVMRMTPTGIFKEIKPVEQEGHLVVCINGQNNTIGRLYRVSRLVLTYFIGGYYKGRRIGFKNGNTRDCSLKNLYWYQGFVNGIDYSYLKSLTINLLDVQDIQVVAYLLNKEIKILFELVKELIPFLYGAMNKFSLKYDIKNNISTIVLKLSDELLKGAYKPVSKFARFKKQDFHIYLFNLVLKIAQEENKYILIDSEQTIDKYLINNSSLC
ncbi:hypothetical protein T190115A13A_60200 [Tenacibaculum sp. 190524A02b]|uniref:NUMOD4 domain-containing protein n=1 Tax=Tenacibaculum vairaonense TaxID=3137860 RepID=A0ABM9PQY8_9FLAO